MKHPWLHAPQSEGFGEPNQNKNHQLYIWAVPHSLSLSPSFCMFKVLPLSHQINVYCYHPFGNLLIHIPHVHSNWEELDPRVSPEPSSNNAEFPHTSIKSQNRFPSTFMKACPWNLPSIQALTNSLATALHSYLIVLSQPWAWDNKMINSSFELSQMIPCSCWPVPLIFFQNTSVDTRFITVNMMVAGGW